ncbi:MAG: response regulator [Ignavibacteriales bacterium]|nr:response regulator [Ignavibacteriales bacterium]
MNKQCEILIIDDEQVVVDSVIKIGEISGYKVDYTMDAKTALEKISGQNYQLIICDIMLPEMDGFQFISEMQSRRNNTPIVITTGYSTMENAVKSLQLGAIDFIPKPFTFDEMTSIMKRGVKYKKLVDADTEKTGSLFYVQCPPRYFCLGYSCWLNTDYDGTVLIGATDLFLKTIENMKTIELMERDEAINQALTAAKIICEDESVHQLYSAISGRIIDRNEKLLNDISLLEKDPYFNGWLYRIIPGEYDYEIKLLASCSSNGCR